MIAVGTQVIAIGKPELKIGTVNEVMADGTVFVYWPKLKMEGLWLPSQLEAVE